MDKGVATFSVSPKAINRRLESKSTTATIEFPHPFLAFGRGHENEPHLENGNSRLPKASTLWALPLPVGSGNDFASWQFQDFLD